MHTGARKDLLEQGIKMNYPNSCFSWSFEKKSQHTVTQNCFVHDVIKSVILSNHPFSNHWIETLKGGRSSSRYNTVSEMFSFFLKCM